MHHSLGQNRFSLDVPTADAKNEVLTWYTRWLESLSDQNIEASLCSEESRSSRGLSWGGWLPTAACFFNQPNCPLEPGPDYDFGQAPVLFDEDKLVLGQKSGVAWGLNRKTGAILWSNIAGPGGISGGFQWGSSLGYDSNGEPLWFGNLVNSEFKAFTLPNGYVHNAGAIIAVEARTGNTLWISPITGGGNGPTSVSGDVVFAPEFDTNYLRAYSVKNGEILWSYQTNSTMMTGPAIVGKRVIFGNGFANPLGQGGTGRNLYNFKAD